MKRFYFNQDKTQFNYNNNGNNFKIDVVKRLCERRINEKKNGKSQTVHQTTQDFNWNDEPLTVAMQFPFNVFFMRCIC